MSELNDEARALVIELAERARGEPLSPGERELAEGIYQAAAKGALDPSKLEEKAAAALRLGGAAGATALCASLGAAALSPLCASFGASVATWVVGVLFEAEQRYPTQAEYRGRVEAIREAYLKRAGGDAEARRKIGKAIDGFYYGGPGHCGGNNGPRATSPRSLSELEAWVSCLELGFGYKLPEAYLERLDQHAGRAPKPPGFKPTPLFELEQDIWTNAITKMQAVTNRRIETAIAAAAVRREAAFASAEQALVAAMIEDNAKGCSSAACGQAVKASARREARQVIEVARSGGDAAGALAEAQEAVKATAEQAKATERASSPWRTAGLVVLAGAATAAVVAVGSRVVRGKPVLPAALRARLGQ